MKIFFRLSLILTVLIFHSCQQDNISYSCNEEINTWVKNNKPVIAKMSKMELLSYNEISQRAIFAAMSVDQRHNLWLEKLNDVIALDWEVKEKEHLYELYKFIVANKTIFMDNRNEHVENEFDIFMYKWIESAKEYLDWNNTTLYAICGTLNKVYKTDKTSRIYILSEETTSNMGGTTRLKSGSELPYNPNQDCSCNKIEDFCGNNNSSSLGGSFIHICEGECQNPTKYGCGWFLRKPCNGGCVGYFYPSI